MFMQITAIFSSQTSMCYVVLSIISIIMLVILSAVFLFCVQFLPRDAGSAIAVLLSCHKSSVRPSDRPSVRDVDVSI